MMNLSAVICGVLLLSGWNQTSAFLPASTDASACRPCTSLSSTKEQKRSGTSSFSLSDSSRVKRAAAFLEWAKSNSIKYDGVEVSGNSAGGLGVLANRGLNLGDFVISVPSSLSLTVQHPKDSNDEVEKMFFDGGSNRKAYRNAPWWAQLSLQINLLDKFSSIRNGIDYKPWLDLLPRKFYTPIHWSHDAIDELQYQHMHEAVDVQSSAWRSEYEKLTPAVESNGALRKISFDDFVWGCECARSRAFSGAYSGSAFNPASYAFTLLLVAAYVGIGLGTIEQAANGACIVFCASIFKDFVLPKLFKSKKYVICPLIDMANHAGIEEKGDVAFEYFSDGYSLAIKGSVKKDSEVFISYGPRSNDQLLQYYGFVEQNNPHDVYIMPPIREWNIGALEEACGRKFGAGRLQKLDKAGLLGSPRGTLQTNAETDEVVRNGVSGVVVTRTAGIDAAVMAALRVLVSSEKEWAAAGESIEHFAHDYAGGLENEKLARVAAAKAIQMELASKPTTMDEDKLYLKSLNSGTSFESSEEKKISIQFRIEKKKLLEETVQKLQLASSTI